MNKKFIFLLVAVAFIAVLVLILQQDGSNNSLDQDITENTQETNSNTVPLTCEEACNGDLTCINNCAVGEVNKILTQDTVNVEECNSIEEINIKEQCVVNVILKDANIKGDPSVCNRIQDSIKSQSCKDNVNYNKAILNGNASLCNQILKQSVKDLCIKSIQ